MDHLFELRDFDGSSGDLCDCYALLADLAGCEMGRVTREKCTACPLVSVLRIDVDDGLVRHGQRRANRYPRQFIARRKLTAGSISRRFDSPSTNVKLRRLGRRAFLGLCCSGTGVGCTSVSRCVTIGPVSSCETECACESAESGLGQAAPRRSVHRLVAQPGVAPGRRGDGGGRLRVAGDRRRACAVGPGADHGGHPRDRVAGVRAAWCGPGPTIRRGLGRFWMPAPWGWSFRT